MRRRITWLVAATSSALVVAFVIPLCALLVVVADDRGASRARDQAQRVASLLGTLDDPTTLTQAVETISSDGPAVVVVTADEQTFGTDQPMADDSRAAVQQARLTRQAVTVSQDHGIDSVVPVARDTGVDVVIATVPRDEVRAGVTAGWAAIIVLGALLVATAVLMARELGRRVSTPVTDLGEVAHRLYEGDLSARAVPAGPEETVEVARALNRLAERIERLLIAERERVADLGHRLRTPVTALRLAADQLADRDASARMDRLIDELHRNVDGVVRDARRGIGEDLPGGTDLAEVVSERAAFWRPLAEDLGREVTVSVPAHGDWFVSMSRNEVQECVDTLLDNCFTHTPEGTAIGVTVGEDAESVWVEISDAGPGLEGDYQGRGHSPGGSTGLGLDIVRRRAEAAGGTLTFGSSHLGGLAVRMRLPRSS